MKTSINVPDELHTTVQDLNPDATFGELVRDALLIALPLWRDEATKGSIVAEMARKLRLAEASADRAVVAPIRRYRPRTVSPDPPAPAAKGPASRPARRPAAAKRSVTKATAESIRQEARRQKRAPSRRK